jgi:hypothetical protein
MFPLFKNKAIQNIEGRYAWKQLPVHTCAHLRSVAQSVKPRSPSFAYEICWVLSPLISSSTVMERKKACLRPGHESRAAYRRVLGSFFGSISYSRRHPLPFESVSLEHVLAATIPAEPRASGHGSQGRNTEGWLGCVCSSHGSGCLSVAGSTIQLSAHSSVGSTVLSTGSLTAQRSRALSMSENA